MPVSKRGIKEERKQANHEREQQGAQRWVKFSPTNNGRTEDKESRITIRKHYNEQDVKLGYFKEMSCGKATGDGNTKTVKGTVS